MCVIMGLTCTLVHLIISAHARWFSRDLTGLVNMGRVVDIALVIAVIWASGCDAEVSRRHKPHKPDQGNCPPCDGPDDAPKPGDFAFYFLVR